MSRSSALARFGLTAMAILVLAACSADPPAARESALAAGASEAAASVTPASSASQSAGGSQVADVCALLDDAEIEEAVGSPVLGKEAAFDGQCQWTLDDGGEDFPTIFVEVRTSGGRASFDILAGEMPPVEVAGGEAYQQGDSVWAVTGDTLVKVIWFSGTVDQMLPLVEAALASVGE